MNTIIKTNSEKQLDQIRRFAKKSKIQHSITQENGTYTITLSRLTISEAEKFIQNFLKTSHLTIVKQQEPKALAA